MHTNTTDYTMDEQARRQRVFICLLLLPFVLFTFSGCTVGLDRRRMEMLLSPGIAYVNIDADDACQYTYETSTMGALNTSQGGVYGDHNRYPSIRSTGYSLTLYNFGRKGDQEPVL